MPMSNYPTGFANGISIRGVPLLQTHPGLVYWVYNGTTLDTGHKNGSDGNAGTFNAPFATLDYAIGRCRANKGDIIMIKPGHAETVSSATALALDVAGIAIVGLGLGAARPTFTLDTANTTTLAVSAANITVSNLLFIGNFLSIASVFTLTTAKDFIVDYCEFRDTSAILGFLSIVTTSATANDADGLVFSNNAVKSDATTTPGPAIVIAGTLDRLDVSENKIVHTVASNNIAALIEHGALVVSSAIVSWNNVYSVNTDTATGALLIKTTAITGSGMVMHNRIRALDVAAAIVVTAAAVQYGMFDNLYIGDGTMNSGFVLPAIGTDA